MTAADPGPRTPDPERVGRRAWPAPAPPPPGPGGFVGPRTRLVTAGQQLLFERGDTTYTVEDLVRRAGVAIKTFYRCYANKEEFLQEVFTVSVNGATPMVRDQILAATTDPLERLRLLVTWALSPDRQTDPNSRAIAHEHMRLTLAHPDTIAATRQPFEALLRDLITDAAEAGVIAPANPEWDAHLITSLITSSYHHLILGLGQPNPEDLATNVWRFTLTALHGNPS